LLLDEAAGSELVHSGRQIDGMRDERLVRI
jgi:hypothetical protein